VLVTGGSLGAEFLDRRVPELIGMIQRQGVPVRVVHQVGDGRREHVLRAYEAVGIDAEVVSYVDDMAGAYALADFVITSSGAGALAEIAAVGLPALVVPLSGATDDHQFANARVFGAASGALCVTTEAWAPDRLARRIINLLRNPAAWSAASRAMRRAAIPCAADRVVEQCEALLAAREPKHGG
jgi:UDP-N-acetylglucosamine--N-acetylmuramyl-(pentapeptide) pyrophosphoryl-undecaprenol N-acetylglucosamine transferase